MGGGKDWAALSLSLKGQCQVHSLLGAPCLEIMAMGSYSTILKATRGGREMAGPTVPEGRRQKGKSLSKAPLPQTAACQCTPDKLSPLPSRPPPDGLMLPPSSRRTSCLFTAFPPKLSTPGQPAAPLFSISHSTVAQAVGPTVQ